MVYTVTFNPALDYAVHTDEIILGETNRSKSEHILTGGKGINVSVVLENLGVHNTALGFIGGFTGKEIRRRVEEHGCGCDFIEVNGLSRINVKLKSDLETEINAKGPVITSDKVDELSRQLEQLSAGDFLVLAGSTPPSVPKTIYGDLIKTAGSDVISVVDATGELLMNTLKYRPFLIKPNNFELSELFSTEIGGDRKKALVYAQKLREMGARNVLVSLAGHGAVLAAESGDVFELDAPKGKVIDSVGAGDSMVAGFITGWLEKNDYEHAFKMGVSAGSASAFSENLAEKEAVISIYSSLNTNNKITKNL
ncbi:MAG: 1-phosphofructokinase [Porcipelethomonas sp.]